MRTGPRRFGLVLRRRGGSGAEALRLEWSHSLAAPATPEFRLRVGAYATVGIVMAPIHATRSDSVNWTDLHPEVHILASRVGTRSDPDSNLRGSQLELTFVRSVGDPDDRAVAMSNLAVRIPTQSHRSRLGFRPHRQHVER